MYTSNGERGQLKKKNSSTWYCQNLAFSGIKFYVLVSLKVVLLHNITLNEQTLENQGSGRREREGRRGPCFISPPSIRPSQKKFYTLSHWPGQIWPNKKMVRISRGYFLNFRPSKFILGILDNILATTVPQNLIKCTRRERSKKLNIRLSIS